MSNTQPDTMRVAVVGTGDGGPSQTGSTTAVTPHGRPDLIVTFVAPLAAVAIRFVNMYLTIFSGLVAAGMTSDAIPAADFGQLLWKCAGLSIAGSVVGLIKDLVTVFGRLENKYPLLTGSV